MSQSKIEWTQMTWNPTTGCDKISVGCKNCYAESFSKRLQTMNVQKYKDGFKLRMHSKVLNVPKKWKEPRIIFVNSMSDLFHERIPIKYIQKVFDVMVNCPQHIFQVLTKRAERLEELSSQLKWESNIWMGVTVENEEVKYRINHLKKTSAKVKFLSLEPLLGPLPKLNLNKINWVIVGGESGKKARPVEKEWIVEIKDQCKKVNVPFFFKQWGGTNKKVSGRLLEGKIYDEIPKVA